MVMVFIKTITKGSKWKFDILLILTVVVTNRKSTKIHGRYKEWLLPLVD